MHILFKNVMGATFVALLLADYDVDKYKYLFTAVTFLIVCQSSKGFCLTLYHSFYKSKR